jgi:hypothetical protein
MSSKTSSCVAPSIFNIETLTSNINSGKWKYHIYDKCVSTTGGGKQFTATVIDSETGKPISDTTPVFRIKNVKIVNGPYIDHKSKDLVKIPENVKEAEQKGQINYKIPESVKEAEKKGQTSYKIEIVLGTKTSTSVGPFYQLFDNQDDDKKEPSPWEKAVKDFGRRVGINNIKAFPIIKYTYGSILHDTSQEKAKKYINDKDWTFKVPFNGKCGGNREIYKYTKFSYYTQNEYGELINNNINMTAYNVGEWFKRDNIFTFDMTFGNVTLTSSGGSYTLYHGKSFTHSYIKKVDSNEFIDTMSEEDKLSMVMAAPIVNTSTAVTAPVDESKDQSSSPVDIDAQLASLGI